MFEVETFNRVQFAMKYRNNCRGTRNRDPLGVHFVFLLATILFLFRPTNWHYSFLKLHQKLFQKLLKTLAITCHIFKAAQA